jgi:hypothetical protein
LAAVSLYSGFPFTASAGANTLNTGAGTRAKRIANGNLPPDQHTVQQWFDINVFVNPGFQQPGFQQPGFQQYGNSSASNSARNALTLRIRRSSTIRLRPSASPPTAGSAAPAVM